MLTLLLLWLLQEVQQCIQEQRASMKEVLEDIRLVTLQREGGAILARMRREEFRFPQSEDYRYQIMNLLTVCSPSISTLKDIHHSNISQCFNHISPLPRPVTTLKQINNI